MPQSTDEERRETARRVRAAVEQLLGDYRTGTHHVQLNVTHWSHDSQTSGQTIVINLTPRS